MSIDGTLTGVLGGTFLRGCARSKLLSRRLVVGRGRSLPSASGRRRSLPSASRQGRSLPSASGRGRSLPSASGRGRSLPSASGRGRSLPSASLRGRSLLKHFAYFPQLLPQQCYNFPSGATTSQAVLQLPKQCYNFHLGGTAPPNH